MQVNHTPTHTPTPTCVISSVPLYAYSTTLRSACMVKGGDIGDLGGGSLEHPSWAPGGLTSSWECRASRSCQARPEEAQESSWGAAKGPL